MNKITKSKKGLTPVVTPEAVGKNGQNPEIKGSQIGASTNATEQNPVTMDIIAERIRGNLVKTEAGIIAFVEMGLLLIAAKNGFPGHGGFLNWMESQFPEVSRRTLYNSMNAAMGILASNLVAAETLRIVDGSLIEQLAKTALGKTRRVLIDQAKQAANTEKEEAARIAVMELLKDNPEKRDYWIPLIEAGERTWGDALRGISGALECVGEDGKKKVRAVYGTFLEEFTKLPSQVKKIGRWEVIPPEVQTVVVDNAVDVLALFPLDVLDSIIKRISEKGSQQS